MKAKKENKIYRITTDVEKQRYLKAGFDIYDDDGKLLEYSPLKKIEYGKYAKFLEETIALRAENSMLKAEIEKDNDPEVISILAAYAAEHGIDLGKASTVSGIVKKINNSKAGE